MAFPVTVPYVFGNMSGLIPLSDLDGDFDAVTAALNGINDGSYPLTDVSVTGGTWEGSPISVTYGGTGQSATPTNGQLLIGNGVSYTLATLTAGNNISITNAAGSVTIAASGNAKSLALTANDVNECRRNDWKCSRDDV
jgi:hypothetical protein